MKNERKKVPNRFFSSRTIANRKYFFHFEGKDTLVYVSRQKIKHFSRKKCEYLGRMVDIRLDTIEKQRIYTSGHIDGECSAIFPDTPLDNE